MTDKKDLSLTTVDQASRMPNIQNVATLAEYLVKSGLFPNAKTLPGCIAVIEYGRELGIPPVAALNTFSIIKGQLAMEAKAMLALGATSGVTWEVISSTDKECKMVFNRPSFPELTVEFTEKDAKDAGLIPAKEFSGWNKYPKDMYFARCASRGMRQIAPDKVLGLYSKEEVYDFENAPVGEDEKEKEYIEAVPEDKEEVDKEFEENIKAIKETVKERGLDLKEFKQWLFDNQKNWRKKYVNRIGKALRFHLGNPKDTADMVKNMDVFIKQYNKEKSEEEFDDRPDGKE